MSVLLDQLTLEGVRLRPEFALLVQAPMDAQHTPAVSLERQLVARRYQIVELNPLALGGVLRSPVQQESVAGHALEDTAVGR